MEGLTYFLCDQRLLVSVLTGTLKADLSISLENRHTGQGRFALFSSLLLDTNLWETLHALKICLFFCIIYSENTFKEDFKKKNINKSYVPICSVFLNITNQGFLNKFILIIY